MPSRRSAIHTDQIRYGIISVVIGGLLTLLMLANADHERRSGNQQFAEDSLMMLWSPAIFGIGGGLFLTRGLLGEAGWAALRSRRLPSARSSEALQPRRSGHPGGEPAAAPARSATLQPSGSDAVPFDNRYRQACAELGVEPGTDWRVIRAIWRSKLQAWHPDQGGSHETWLRKNAAYALLEAWEHFKT